MGLGTITDEPEEQTTEEDSSNSKTQVVFWKHAAPKGYEEHADLIEQAYELCNGSGWLRNILDRSPAYEDIHALAAELLVGAERVLREGDYQQILGTVDPDADAILQYLEDNPEVGEEVVEQLQGAEAQTADD